MSTAKGSVLQYHEGRKSSWSSVGWKTLDTAPSWGKYSSLASTSYGHRVCFEVKMPAFSGKATSLTFTWRGKHSEGSYDTTYANIHPSFTEYTYGTSNNVYVNDAVSGSGTGSLYYSSTSWGKRSITISLNGNIASDGTYYIYLYTTNSNAVYYIGEGSSYYSLTLEYTPTCKVSFNSNGGSGTMPAQEVITNSEITLPTNSFTAPSGTLYETTLNGNGGKNGTPTYGANAFYRWRLNSTSGTLYKAGDTYTPTSNATFYAQWYTPTTLGTTTRDNSTNPGYTITFDATANGGTCNTASLTVSNPVSHTFKNWNSTSNGSGATWDDTTAVYQITSNITLYAQWESTETLGTINLPTASKSSSNAQNRTVTLNYNDGSGKTETKTSTATITYTFQGWSTSATATTGSTGTYKPTSSHKLYAIFKGTTGTYSAVSLPSPTRTGYTFVGWGTSTSATSGATGSYIPSGNITLYAIWKPNGAVRIYIEGQGYRMAQVYLYANNKWNLTIPYLYNGSWKMST